MALDDQWVDEKTYFSSYDQFQDHPRYHAMKNWHLRNLEKYFEVVEIGSGTGNLTLDLLKKRKKVLAIEPDLTGLGVLEEKCASYKNNLSLIKDKAENALNNLQGDSELAITSMITFPFPDVSTSFHEVYRVLKEEGKFVVTAWLPHPDLHQGVFGYIEDKLNLSNSNEEWKLTKERGLEFVDFINSTGIHRDDYLHKLDEIGFRNIRPHSNLYDDLALSFTCNK